MDLKIDSSDPSRIYVATWGAEIFRSLDGGVNWRAARKGLPDSDALSLAVGPQGSRAIYAILNGGWVFQSSDSGESWRGLPVLAVAVAVNPRDPAEVYAIGNGELARSIDGGASWTSVTSDARFGWEGPVFGGLFIDPADTSTLYALTSSNGLVKSTNRGVDWKEMNNGLPPLGWSCSPGYNCGLAFDPFAPATLYLAGESGAFRSDDGGESWKAINTGFPSPRHAYAIAAHPSTPGMLYAAANGVYVSSDRGETWRPSGLELAGPVSGIAIDPHHPSTLYATTLLQGVFKSVDGGAHWLESDSGLNTASVLSMVATPGMPPKLFVGTDDGVAHSDDGGTKWAFATLDSATVFRALLVDPRNPNIVYAGSACFPIHKSLDGGDTWVESYAGMSLCEVIEGLAVDPRSPSTLFAAANQHGVYKSSDGGGHWILSNRNLTRTDATRIVLDPTNSSILYLATEASLFKSTDRGETWAGTGLSLDRIESCNAIIIDPNDPQTLYVGGASGIFKSLDGAVTWEPANEGLTETWALSLVMSPSNSLILYAGTRGAGVFQTIDGGLHWWPMNEGLDQPFVRALAFDEAGQYLYAGTSGGVYVIDATVRGPVVRTDRPRIPRVIPPRGER